MKLTHTLFAGVMSLAIAGCTSVDTASRNAAYQPAQPTVATAPEVQQQLSLASYSVTVPSKLVVSEANRYYPSGDIVWRGDAIGDRHAQVKAIFDASLAKAKQTTSGGYPVVVDVEVVRFHALTEKARYTVGGVHAITFKLQLKHAKTGELLAPTRMVTADLQAFGGEQAVRAEAAGLTQKVRITAHLAEVFRQEMAQYGAYRNEALGFFQAVNKL